MELAVIGICTAFNFCVIIRKWRLKRFFDCVLDTAILTAIALLFNGTFSALATGMVASMAVSFYLYFNPITLAEAMGEKTFKKGKKA